MYKKERFEPSRPHDLVMTKKNMCVKKRMEEGGGATATTRKDTVRRVLLNGLSEEV